MEIKALNIKQNDCLDEEDFFLSCEVYIGQYNNNGKFDCEQWNRLFHFFDKYVDSICIYSFDEDEMQNSHVFTNYEVLEDIGSCNCLYGYKIMHVHQAVLDYIRDYSYSIDGGIQFLYFFREGRMLAEVQIEDSDNFVTLYLTSKEEMN